MELCLDNVSSKNCIDMHQVEGYDASEVISTSDPPKAAVSDNYIEPIERHPDLADTEKGLFVQLIPCDGGVPVIDLEMVAENSDSCSEESGNGDDATEGRNGDHFDELDEDEHYEDAFEMHQEKSVNGITDCICISDDVVDGCTVTDFQVEVLASATDRFSFCEEVDYVHCLENCMYEDDEEAKEDVRNTKSVSLSLDDAEIEKFDGCRFDDHLHGFANPVLRNILTEEMFSVDNTQCEQSEIPATLNQISFVELNIDAPSRELQHFEQDALVGSVDDRDLKHSLEIAHLHDVSSSEDKTHQINELKRSGDDFVGTERTVWCASNVLKPPYCQDSDVSQSVTNLPTKELASSGDSFKEPPVVILRTKNRSKRVDSIRKSLIKLGSFGKEHGNGKGKNKKDKDKPKNGVQDKQVKSDIESALHGHPSGSATSEPVPGCVQQPEHSTVRHNTSEALVQTPSSVLPGRRISNPRAVDDEQLQLYSAQTQNTVLLMYHQAVQEFQRKSEEYLKFPTASNRHEIESQAALINKLKAKLDLSSHQLYQSNDTEVMMTKREKSSEFATTIKVTGGDMSPDSACILEEKRDVVAGLPPLQRSNPNCLAVAKKDSSLTRSHSDSFKKGRMEMNDRLRQGNSSDDISSLKLVNARTSVRNRYTERRGKIETEHSANSSDSAIDQISPASDSSIMAPVSSTSSLSSNNRREIMAIDDQEFQSDEENFNTQGGPFSDFSKLTQQPAHLAVFLHFLILNSDPSPVLFYLITESYRQGSLKEMRKWAYEIFSAFLVEKAPLKIHVDEQTVERIHTTLVNRHDKEDAMRSIFCQTCLQFVMPAIDYLLSDFRNKQSLGLGNLYGTHQLTEKQDAAELAKVIESTLWNHFDSFMANEEQERDAAMASALAFLFKQFSYTNMKNNLLERCSAFNAKEKNKFQMFSKPSKKVTFHLGHQLFPQQYYTMTNCIHCQNLLCGVGPQGYQCQKCEFNFHKLCKDNIKESCSGKKGQRLPPVVMDKPKPPITEKPKPPITEKPKPQTTVFGNKKKKQNSFNSSSSHAASAREENNSTANIFTRLVVQPEEDASSVAVSQNRAVDKSEPPKSADDGKSSPTSCRSRSPTETGSIDDKQIFMVSSDVAEHPKPLSTRDIENGHAADAVSLGKSSFSDSDLEAEADLPSLDSIIPKEQFKKLKPKEKKRQEVINELFHTEQAHVRNLKIMHRLFYEPMQNEQPALFVKLLFPNLDDMIEVHGNLNRDFKQKRKESENSVVGDFANILVRHFSDEQGLRFKTVCASFCEKQSHALELLKQRQRKDPKLAALLQETAGNSLCRRLELKDFLPTAMQRLTKYPLLIENLLKYTQVELEEYQLLQLAYRSSKEILNYVNKAVQDYENRLKLVELQKKIDKRPIESSNNPVVLEFKNLDLTNHILVYDGTLTWRLNRDRLINLHVVLLEGILLLLQKQDEKLVLRCQSTLIVAGKEDTKLTHSPIIKLSNVLIKPVATDKCAFFLVSTSAIGPQIYDLVAGSKDEKNKWCKRIMDAVEVFKLKNPVKPIVQPSKSLPPQASASQKNAEDPKLISPADLSEVTMTNESIACCPDEHLNHEPPEPPDTAVNEESLQQNKQELPTADEVSVDHQQSLSLSEYLDKIQDLDEDIRRSLSQKRELLLKLGQLPEEDFDFTLELPPLPAKNSDPKDVLLTMVTKSNCLAQHVDSLLMSDEPVIDSEVILDGDPPPLPPRNPIVSPTEALPPPLPPRLYRALPKLPISQLMDYCAWMNSNLSYLMRSFAKVEEENKQLTGLLRTAQEEFKLLLDEHESEDIHLNEQDSIDPPNFFTRETEFVAEACPGQGEFIIQANDSEIKNEHFFEPVLSDTEHVEISSACQALEEFDLKENVTEIEDGHTFESISTDPQNSFTSETKAVDSSASQEFTLQQYTEGQDCEMEISDRDDRDAKPDSNDDCETGVDFSITVQSIANIEDIDQAQDTEDSVTVVAETQFSDCVTDSIDCSDSVQHSSTEALIVPLENSEDFAT